MLVRTEQKIVNLDKIRQITIEDVYLKDTYKSDESARAIFAIAILIATENAIENLTWYHAASEEESELTQLESTKVKVREYALNKLADIFEAKDLTDF